MDDSSVNYYNNGFSSFFAKNLAKNEEKHCNLRMSHLECTYRSISYVGKFSLKILFFLYYLPLGMRDASNEPMSKQEIIISFKRAILCFRFSEKFLSISVGRIFDR